MLGLGMSLARKPGKKTGPPPPTLHSATTNTAGTVITLTFDKPMADPTGKHAEFEATIAGSARSISAAALNANTTKINLTISGAAIANGNTVTISFTKGTVAAADGGKLESFTGQAVTNAVPTLYQQWPGYPDTPVLTSDYPKQSIHRYSSSEPDYLICAETNLYIVSGPSIRQASGNYFRMYSHQGSAWSYISSFSQVWLGTPGFLQANNAVFTDVSQTTVFFAKTTA